MHKAVCALLFTAACAARPLDVPELPMPVPQCVAKPVPARPPLDLRGAAVASADDGLIYVILGGATWAYDPTAATWTERASLKAGADNEPSAAASGGVVYLVNDTKLLAYDIASNTWSAKKSPQPSFIGDAPSAAAGPDGKIYVRGAGTFGGIASRYDPSTDEWSTLDAFAAPDSTYQPSAFADGYWYSFGVALDVFYPTIGTWGAGTSPPHRREFAAGAALDGKLYLTGGMQVSDGNEGLPIDIFTPELGSWDTGAPPVLVTIGAHAAAGCNGQLYVFGGNNAGGDAAFNVVQSYDPATDTWQASQ